MFLEESIALGNYIETYEKKHNKNSGSDFVRITIKGLSALAAEHGFDSIQYQTGQQILKEFLQLVREKAKRPSWTKGLQGAERTS